MDKNRLTKVNISQKTISHYHNYLKEHPVLHPFEKSKESYYKKYLESNWINTKIIWKGFKSTITLKNITSSVSKTILQQENLISNPYDIANIFNNCFFSVADTAKKHIKYSRKHFLDDLIIRAIILCLFILLTVRI